MKARVRVIQEIELDGSVLEPSYEDHPRARTSAPGQVATNEDDVLASSVSIAREAEEKARDLFPDAVKIVVEEVLAS